MPTSKKASSVVGSGMADEVKATVVVY